MDILFNLVIVLCTLFSTIICFRDKEGNWSFSEGCRRLRFFTLLSNLFCAFASLSVLLSLRHSELPYGIWLFKYIGTASVTVTFLTVMVFLGPTLGYKSQLEGWAFYLHVVGPLLAIISFCFFERAYPLSFYSSLWGIAPVFLYGCLYLKKVVFSPGVSQWDDFYGFNRNGKWRISFSAMLVGAFFVCILLWGLCKL